MRIDGAWRRDSVARTLSNSREYHEVRGKKGEGLAKVLKEAGTLENSVDFSLEKISKVEDIILSQFTSN